MAFKDIQNYLENKTSFSVRERFDMPDSDLRFDGGAHCRIEISGIENASNLEAMVR